MLDPVVMLGMFLNAFVIKQSIINMYIFSTKKAADGNCCHGTGDYNFSL